MKLCLICDTHWGIRNDNILFLDSAKKFLDNIFFPYIDNNNIGTIIHLGDLLDRRKYCNILTANRMRQDFIEPIEKRNIEFHHILGNHDVFYKNTNTVNSVTEFLKNTKNFYIYETATELEFDGLKILFVPWICDDNREETLSKIKNTYAHICFGHLELTGFEMFKGVLSTHGDSPELFNRFDVVASGHFHHKSIGGNINYLGNHMEFDWSDYGDDKGFHIFDTETRKLEFVKNPYTIFNKIVYDDTNGKEMPKVKAEDITGKIIKLIIRNKSNLFYFDKYLEKIEKLNPSDLQIIEDYEIVNVSIDVDTETETTHDILLKYIDNITDEKIDTSKLKMKMNLIYQEALNIT